MATKYTKQYSNRYKDIVILTGAGISEESGIPTFRGESGIWSQYNLNEVATLEGFKKDPRKVYEFYNERRRHLLSNCVHENEAHKALARFEKWTRGRFSLITQNIDDLHERAGSVNVYHIHGELLSARCTETSRRFGWENDLNEESINPRTKEAGKLRPDVVWFGEELINHSLVTDIVQSCRLFVAIGTSGMVYPASAYVEKALVNGARTVEINLEKSSNSHLYQEHIFGNATEVVPKFIDKLINEKLYINE